MGEYWRYVWLEAGIVIDTMKCLSSTRKDLTGHVSQIILWPGLPHMGISSDNGITNVARQLDP